MARTEDSEISKRLLKEPTYSKRWGGRPRLRWTDGVAADARSILGVHNWIGALQEHDNWVRLLQEIKTRQGVVVPI